MSLCPLRFDVRFIAVPFSVANISNYLRKYGKINTMDLKNIKLSRKNNPYKICETIDRNLVK